METASIEKWKSSGRPRTSNETVEAIQEVFVQRPLTSVQRKFLELHIPRLTFPNILCKYLRLQAYKIQTTQELQTCD